MPVLRDNLENVAVGDKVFLSDIFIYLGLPSSVEAENKFKVHLEKIDLVTKYENGKELCLFETAYQVFDFRTLVMGLLKRVYSSGIYKKVGSDSETTSPEQNTSVNLRKIISELGLDGIEKQKDFLYQLKNKFGFTMPQEGFANHTNPDIIKMMILLENGTLLAADFLSHLEKYFETKEEEVSPAPKETLREEEENSKEKEEAKEEELEEVEKENDEEDKEEEGEPEIPEAEDVVKTGLEFSSEMDTDVFVRQLFLFDEENFDQMSLYQHLELGHDGEELSIEECERNDLIFRVIRGAIPFSVGFILKTLRWNASHIDILLKTVSENLSEVINRRYSDIDANFRQQLFRIAETAEFESSLQVIDEYPLEPEFLEICVGSAQFNTWLIKKLDLLTDVIGVDPELIRKTQLGVILEELPTAERLDAFLNIKGDKEINCCDEKLYNFFEYFNIYEEANISPGKRKQNKTQLLMHWELSEEQLDILKGRIRFYKRNFSPKILDELRGMHLKIDYRLMAKFYGKTLSEYFKEGNPGFYNSYFGDPWFALEESIREEINTEFFKSDLHPKTLCKNLERIGDLRVSTLLLCFITGLNFDSFVSEFDTSDFGRKIGSFFSNLSEDVREEVLGQFLVGKLKYEKVELEEAVERIFPEFDIPEKFLPFLKDKRDIIESMATACHRGIDWKLLPNDIRRKGAGFCERYLASLRNEKGLEEKIPSEINLKIVLEYFQFLRAGRQMEFYEDEYSSHKSLAPILEKLSLLIDCLLYNEFFRYEDEARMETKKFCKKLQDLGDELSVESISALEGLPIFFPSLQEFFINLYTESFEKELEPFHKMLAVLLDNKDKLELFSDQYVRYNIRLARKGVEETIGYFDAYSEIKKVLPEKRPKFKGKKDYDQKIKDLEKIAGKLPRVLRNFSHFLSHVGSKNKLTKSDD